MRATCCDGEGWLVGKAMGEGAWCYESVGVGGPEDGLNGAFKWAASAESSMVQQKLCTKGTRGIKTAE